MLDGLTAKATEKLNWKVWAPSTPLATTPRSAAGSVTTAPVREVGQPLDIAHGRLVGDAPAPGAEIAPAPESTTLCTLWRLRLRD
jgi:hypothetical protein